MAGANNTERVLGEMRDILLRMERRAADDSKQAVEDRKQAADDRKQAERDRAKWEEIWHRYAREAAQDRKTWLAGQRSMERAIVGIRQVGREMINRMGRIEDRLAAISRLLKPRINGRDGRNGGQR